MARQAVLLKVQIQTVWCEVDTDSGFAVEHVDPPITIPGAMWAEFYEKWVEDWVTLKEQVSAADVSKEKALTNGHQG